MKDKHIIEILENAPLASLTESETKIIRAHIEICDECLRAYQAAQISTALIKERVAETIEPLPFFHTRVMAAIREQKASEVSAFKRFWKAANSLIYSMTATVVVLVVFTFFTLGISTDSAEQDSTFSANQYSAEDILLTRGDALSDNHLTDEEVFSAIYEP